VAMVLVEALQYLSPLFLQRYLPCSWVTFTRENDDDKTGTECKRQL